MVLALYNGFRFVDCFEVKNMGCIGSNLQNVRGERKIDSFYRIFVILDFILATEALLSFEFI